MVSGSRCACACSFRLRLTAYGLRFLTSLLVLLIAACAAVPYNTEPVDRLLGLVQERLLLAEDVAQNKWNSGAPIEDLAREYEIIEQVGNDASRYGIPRDLARDFFRAQIKASKIIQNARFDEWRAAKQAKFTRVADLQGDNRPALDALTPKLLNALAQALPMLKNPGLQNNLDSRSIAVMKETNRAACETALAPLKQLRDEQR
jgi:chorismate mutase